MTIDVYKFLSVDLGLGASAAAQLIRTAPDRYAHFKIPKRKGGTRDISQPASELKIVQRALVDWLLVKLPVHPAATAYQAETSIRMNAARHAETLEHADKYQWHFEWHRPLTHLAQSPGHPHRHFFALFHQHRRDSDPANA